MSTAKATVCREPGCYRRVKGANRCREHILPPRRPRPRPTGQRRPSAAARGYDAQWAAVAKDQLKRHPQCAVCRAPATEVDHIKPVRRWPRLRLTRANLQSMCRKCHAVKTARQERET